MCTAGSILATWTVQEKPVLAEYRTGHENKTRHEAAPSLPVMGISRALKQAFTRHGVPLRRRGTRNHAEEEH